jgi:hypothetical protein
MILAFIATKPVFHNFGMSKQAINIVEWGIAFIVGAVVWPRAYEWLVAKWNPRQGIN